jgi:hypothetical protein
VSDKPKMIPVTDPAEIEALKRGAQGELDAPYGIEYAGRWYAEASELERYRQQS